MIESGGEELRRLHAKGAGVLVPMAWDVRSARTLAQLGFPTIAIRTAAGARFEELVDAVAAIATATDRPLTVDAGLGYEAESGGVAAMVERLAAAGAAGVSVGDGHDPVAPEQLERLVRAARAAGGAALWIEARTAALGLAPSLAAAGADCVLVPGLIADAEIRALADATPVALAVARVPQLPPAQRLGELGVARIVVGANVVSTALAEAGRLAGDLTAPTAGILHELLAG